MLRWGVPILLAGLGGLWSERAGVVNIGLEGMMVLGTWFGAWGALQFGPWVGLLLGMLGGALGGLVHAVATVQFGVDHVISGVAINILGPGLARFLSSEVFTKKCKDQGGSSRQSPRVPTVGRFTFPVSRRRRPVRLEDARHRSAGSRRRTGSSSPTSPASCAG